MTKALQPQFVAPLTEIEDQVAGCVFLSSHADASVVRARLTTWFNAVEYEIDRYVFVIAEHWKPDEWRDQAEMPTTFELQIRTLAT